MERGRGGEGGGGGFVSNRISLVFFLYHILLLYIIVCFSETHKLLRSPGNNVCMLVLIGVGVRVSRK